MTENPETFYGKRGVVSVAGMVALLKIFLKGSDFPGLVLQNIKEKEKYTKQGKDPSYKTSELPLISTDGTGIRPQFHQEEVLNLLRDLPENAAVPVSAGGGKCITPEHVVTHADHSGDIHYMDLDEEFFEYFIQVAVFSKTN
jgi:hypothetical protein